MDKRVPKPRVVVIDDNQGFRAAAEAFLRTLECVEFAGAANDGIAGLELITRQRPDAAIIDLSMPGMNGLALAERLRGGPDAPGIVLVSMQVDPAVRDEAKRIGIDAVLPKEDFVGRLPAVLQAIVRKRLPGSGQ
jgi:DNA-binding NarL/FixJ family response regulator